MLNQSDIIQSENDLDAIDEQELDSRIMGMVDRLLERIFAWYAIPVWLAVLT